MVEVVLAGAVVDVDGGPEGRCALGWLPHTPIRAIAEAATAAATRRPRCGLLIFLSYPEQARKIPPSNRS